MDFKRVREEREKDIAKEKLISDCIKKIQTTMIGSLATIEKHFGFLWENDEYDGNMDGLFEVYKKLRLEILDKGNDQIRALEKEFKNYDINFKRYYIKLPFRDNN